MVKMVNITLHVFYLKHTRKEGNTVYNERPLFAYDLQSSMAESLVKLYGKS